MASSRSLPLRGMVWAGRVSCWKPPFERQRYAVRGLFAVVVFINEGGSAGRCAVQARERRDAATVADETLFGLVARKMQGKDGGAFADDGNQSGFGANCPSKADGDDGYQGGKQCGAFFLTQRVVCLLQLCIEIAWRRGIQAIEQAEQQPAAHDDGNGVQRALRVGILPEQVLYMLHQNIGNGCHDTGKGTVASDNQCGTV